MIWVSLVSEPLDGLRLPSLAVRPSPKPTATDGTPIARMSAAAIAYLPGEERNFKGASRVVWSLLDLRHPRPRPGCGDATGKVRTATRRSALARLLGRVDRHRHREVQCGADDAVLLHRVRGRVALARAGALGPADVAELEVAREH